IVARYTPPVGQSTYATLVRSDEEAGQTGCRSGPEREQDALEVAERVCDGLRLAPAVLRRPAAHPAAGREAPRLAGFGAEERVTRPRLPAHDGLEQEAEVRPVPAPLEARSEEHTSEL